MLTDVDHRRAAERADDLRARGFMAVSMEHDATEEGAWEKVLEAIVAEYGTLDILVNNAAICVSAHVADMELSDWRRQVDMRASTRWMEECLPTPGGSSRAHRPTA